MEKWKDVAGYEGLYQVSNLGRIKSVERYRDNHGKPQIIHEKIKNTRTKNSGYLITDLYKNNKRKSVMIHRVVASAFLPVEEIKETVNHKDGNKFNNNVENLEWSSFSEQNKHFYKKGLKSKENIKKAVKAMNEKSARKILCVETNEIFDSLSDASLYSKGDRKGVPLIVRSAKTKTTTAYGYHWNYVDQKGGDGVQINETIVRGAKIELAKRRFFFYCNLIMPKFYEVHREYLVRLCDELQKFLNDDEHDVLIINLPPQLRHGKSLTLGKFVEWVLGNDHTKKIMTGSYNETLSTVFSKNVRNTLQEEKADENKIVYSDIFDAAIKYGDAAKNLWSLSDGYNNYLATSPTGTATGFGADIIIIDDVIKNAEEANNATVLEKHWDWFVNTMLSRLESGGKIIINMTRWHSEDLAGRALRELPKNGYRVKHINFKAYNEQTNEMLCDDILTIEDYKRKVKTMGADIASANYQQEPIDIKGRLYGEFQTYNARSEYKKIWNYCDTADTGKDYLCSIVWGETTDGYADVLDVIYTQKPMEYTENAVANQLINNRVNASRIERNNGGRSFARSVRDKIQGKVACAVEDFFQGNNKEARIYSNSYWIEQHVRFPNDWRTRFPEYYQAMTTYQREGKNKHDDAPDATTGIAETMITRKAKLKSFKGGF